MAQYLIILQVAWHCSIKNITDWYIMFNMIVAFLWAPIMPFMSYDKCQLLRTKQLFHREKG